MLYKKLTFNNHSFDFDGPDNRQFWITDVWICDADCNHKLSNYNDSFHFEQFSLVI